MVKNATPNQLQSMLEQLQPASAPSSSRQYDLGPEPEPAAAKPNFRVSELGELQQRRSVERAKKLGAQVTQLG